MNSLALLIDFGSTYTKVVAVDLRSAEVIGRSQAASTVNTDVREGLIEALVALDDKHSLFTHRPTDLTALAANLVLASSSAAGGLRMAVIGLVPGLTVEAANTAALGAGANVVGSWSFKLATKALSEIEAQRPDMILLTGGTDGGDSATILHNARVLACSALSVPIVMAGNQAVAGQVRDILTNSGKEVRYAANVMPRTGCLAVDSAREAIRKLFMEHITRAKGLDGISGLVPVVLPTPMAVLQGAMLGAQGTDEEDGWGDLLVVDVGGATTDVHSIGFGQATGPQIVEQGLAEAFAKRTVEGDLGIRFNARTLRDRVGLDDFEKGFRGGFPGFKVSREQLTDYIEQISRETSRVPREAWHSAVDAQLARVAVDLAVERHVGKRERIVTHQGETWVYYGKDLTETRTLIGTGGVFIYNAHVSHILSPAAGGNRHYDVLRPKSPNLFVDLSYLLYAVGLLSTIEPDVALRLFKNNMRRLDGVL
ncbi:MAG TPA: methylaspartate mutase accessory protein GlmL [Candidatus Binatia bacterium]|nr:methylaspartate mutase accessory protein GlmL [Candidatus Binatia bacterium]